MFSVGPPPRVAVVHDWLDTWRGGEAVLVEVLSLFPDATLFALVDFLPEAARDRIGGRHAHTSFLQHVPGARRYFRTLLPLMPAAVERLDLRGFDLVISISHAVAKGVRTRADQLHVCLCLSPIRYAWDLREEYLAVTGFGRGLRGMAIRTMLERIRRWDLAASGRVTQFVAISVHIAGRIRRCYGRDSLVVYPPVDTEYFGPGADAHRDDYYLAGSRFVPYKRLDLVAAAFRELPGRRLVIFGDGPEAGRVRTAAGAHAEFVGAVSRERLRDLLRNARAFIFAADEDFGILPVEAQACGTPVIAFGRGGALETVRPLGAPRPTGMFFDEQSAPAIAEAVRRFEQARGTFVADDAVENARLFSVERFRSNFANVASRTWAKFTRGRARR